MAITTGTNVFSSPVAAQQKMMMMMMMGNNNISSNNNTMKMGASLPFVFKPAVSPRRTRGKNEPMPTNFEPGNYDVVCGLRGKQALQHIGNRRFRLTIAMNVDRYLKAITKLDKSLIVISIVDTIRGVGGNFVKQNLRTRQWLEIGDQQAREKVGHALRDIINSNEERKRNGADQQGFDSFLHLICAESEVSRSSKSSPRKRPNRKTLRAASV